MVHSSWLKDGWGILMEALDLYQEWLLGSLGSAWLAVKLHIFYFLVSPPFGRHLSPIQLGSALRSSGLPSIFQFVDLYASSYRVPCVSDAGRPHIAYIYIYICIFYIYKYIFFFDIHLYYIIHLVPSSYPDSLSPTTCSIQRFF